MKLFVKYAGYKDWSSIVTTKMQVELFEQEANWNKGKKISFFCIIDGYLYENLFL